MRTGLTLLEGATSSSGTGDITTLMNHAEVALRVACPGSFSFRIFFYMSIDGTTAWHAGAPHAPRPPFWSHVPFLLLHSMHEVHEVDCLWHSVW